MKVRPVIYVLCLLLLSGCGEQPEVRQKEIPMEILKKELEKKNKVWVAAEKTQIEKYIERHRLNMKNTPNGIYYQILEKGNGPAINEGDKVTVSYEIGLLNGEVLYTSKEKGPKTFQVGKDYIESGIQQVMMMLNKGDSALIILRRHLAFGLTGDYNKIPPNATVVYRIRVLNQ